MKKDTDIVETIFGVILWSMGVAFGLFVLVMYVSMLWNEPLAGLLVTGVVAAGYVIHDRRVHGEFIWKRKGWKMPWSKK